MEKIQFYPVEISSKNLPDRIAVSLYGRTPEGKQICVHHSFEPYFYILSQNAAEIKKRIDAENQIFVIKTETVNSNYFGKAAEAVKVTVKPDSFSEARASLKKFGSILEADIPLTRKYLIDKNITPLTLCLAEGEFIEQRSRVSVFNAESVMNSGTDVMPDLRVLSIDIETHSPVGKLLVPENPILMIGFSGENFNKVITWKRFETSLDYVEFVESEAQLIEKFSEITASYKPDVLVGYYSDGFDLPYIRERADKYKIELNLGLDYSSLKFTKGQVSSAYISGITHLDIFKFIKNVVATSLNTVYYDLNAVSKEILNESKNSVNLDKLPEIWDSRPEELGEYCVYNLQDAVLTYKLAKKLMPNIIELVKLTGLPIYDISRMGFSQLVEWHLIKRAPDFNELIPNKPGNEEIGRRMQNTYEGGFVFEPKPGLYKDVLVFDFRSLYPTIISAHNISPDTLDCSCCKEDAEHWFCKNRRGFVSSVINDLVVRRMRVKEIIRSTERDILLEARESALKTIANAMYGYMGFFGARWYSLDCAKSITLYGRQYIQKVIERAKNEGFNVLYSDTDSIFLALDGKTRENAQMFADSINLELPELMELEFEGFYTSGIFVSAKASDLGAKKKYALLDEKGRIKIKGFETVRRNLSLIAREVQETVLGIILREENPEKALAYVKDVIKKMKNNEIPLEKVVINTQLRKEVGSYDSISPHVAAAQRMKNLGRDIAPGAIISYIVVQGKERIRDRARLPEEVSQNDYDPEYYINNQIVPSVEKIFEVLGFKKEDIVGREQSKLDEFFGK